MRSLTGTHSFLLSFIAGNTSGFLSIIVKTQVSCTAGIVAMMVKLLRLQTICPNAARIWQSHSKQLQQQPQQAFLDIGRACKRLPQDLCSDWTLAMQCCRGHGLIQHAQEGASLFACKFDSFELALQIERKEFEKCNGLKAYS